MNICATVGIKTEMTLEELATVISERICGGIKLIGIEDSIRDEIPAVYTAKEFLGLRIVLYGDNGDFAVEIGKARAQKANDVGAEYTDLSKHLKVLLNEIDGVYPY